MAAHFLTRRGLAGTQQYRYRPRHRRVIDMDRQKTALVVMGIKERQLLVTVHDINRVIEVERHRDGRGRIAVANRDHRSLARDNRVVLPRLVETGAAHRPKLSAMEPTFRETGPRSSVLTRNA